jgi:hypothetical protein
LAGRFAVNARMNFAPLATRLGVAEQGLPQPGITSFRKAQCRLFAGFTPLLRRHHHAGIVG